MITTHRIELEPNVVDEPDFFENGDRIDLSSVRLEVEGERTFASFNVDSTYRISDENEAKAEGDREFYSAYGAETGITLALLDGKHLAGYREEHYQFPTKWSEPYDATAQYEATVQVNGKDFTAVIVFEEC